MVKKFIITLIMLSFCVFFIEVHAEVTTGNVEFYYGETTEDTTETTTETSTTNFSHETTESTAKPPFGQFGETINQMLGFFGIILIAMAIYNIIKIRRLSK